MLEWYGERADLSFIRDSDLETIAAPLDFFGVNYYEQHHVVADTRDPVHGARKLTPLAPVTSAGIGIRPEGLAAILVRIAEEYTRLPLYVTENGATFFDYLDPNGDVHDIERVEYLDGHFRATHNVIARGIDVRGYFVWSLFDNFEWAEGYFRRFGIVYVDFSTQRRIPKSSARWYSELIASQASVDVLPA